MADDEFVRLRRQVLRRVRYALNTVAVVDDRLPPDGLFDVALSNGLAAIVAAEWPGADTDPDNPKWGYSAKRLLTEIEERTGGAGLSGVDVPVLRDGLRLTQPNRHGMADDEWVTMGADQLKALRELDGHPALNFLSYAVDHSVDDCIWRAYLDRAESELPLSPKDRLGRPIRPTATTVAARRCCSTVGTSSAATTRQGHVSPAGMSGVTKRPGIWPSPRRSADTSIMTPDGSAGPGVSS